MREKVSCRGASSREQLLSISFYQHPRKYGVDHRKLKPEEELVTADKVSGKDGSDATTYRNIGNSRCIVSLKNIDS